MPEVQRQGDPNNEGGIASSGVASVRVNGKPVVVNGTSVTGHKPFNQKKHRDSVITRGGIASVRAEGKPVNVNGNADTCDHVRVSGSPNVRAG